MIQANSKEETAILGGGCFWCIEAVFEELQGVTKVESGYSGGKIANPTYREVCSGLTGHAEVIRVFFDPARITYKEILSVFFSVHDPTTLNRQGADVGTQYRSVIFYNSEQQRQEAEEVIEELKRQEVYNKPVVTEISPAGDFFVAENYHQNYFENNPNQPYCQVVINPKLKKFREKFEQKLK
ncbi:peptide-methionine (S)-S-oxide reductase [Marinilabilia salmonicolor]|jgi:peptide-methionine (S)-S-oxide reductase|uniref:Peptide methionine sulfoxide reductase MsrA n=2 Tax=Marinilabilia salmonicolor TaxID=989 RepID=A0A368VI87_9BACT|nr:peptide-methionine (S)-S-oxide reductase [Marinilabilia salmonicolor]